MTASTDWRFRLARLAAAAACAALAWTVVVAQAGGIRGYLGPVLVSSRDWQRSGLVAALLYITALILSKPGSRAQPWAWIVERAAARSFVIALAAAAAVLAFGLQYGTRVAGGADSLGYVSQAYLWLNGDLRIEQPLAAEAPWPFAGESLSPLGYRPGASRHTIVPTYSPGLPIIMAGSLAVCGPCGPFFTGPFFGAMLVLFTWLLAWRVTRTGLTSALAALMMAASPVFLFNLVAPMSDVVTAALFIASMCVLTWPRLWHAAAAGVVAGAAILVRPNLAPLCLAGVMAAEMWATRTDRAPRRGRRAMAYLAGLFPALLIVGALNDQLYGSPLLSGYGPTADLYALSRFQKNLRLYATWLLDSQGVVMVLALVPVLFRRARPAWLTISTAIPILVFVVLLCLSYLFYLEFDGWPFLRFFLPAFPFLFVLMAGSFEWLMGIAPHTVGVPALVVVTVAVLTNSVSFAIERGVRELGDGEQRYFAVAEYVDRGLPPNAAIISKQHSGTIAFYSGRTTIRYDYLPHQRLQSIVEWLQQSGRPPYIVLEDWEEPAFRRRFAAAQDAVSRLDIRVLAETGNPPLRVRVYDPLQAADPAATHPRIPATSIDTCAEGRGAWKR